MLIFSGVAYLLALTGGEAGSHLTVRLAIELPMLLLAATLASVAINAVAAFGGGVFGGSNLVAAMIAGGLAWALADSGLAAGAPGLDAQLRLALSIALAAAWVVGANRQTA